MPPAIIAIAAAVVQIAAAAGVISTIAAAVITLALTVAAIAFAKKPQRQLTQAQELQLKVDPTINRQVLVGKTATGGSSAWAFTTSRGNAKKPNGYLYRVIVISDRPCNALVGVYEGTAQLTFDGDITTGWYACNQHIDKNGVRKLYMRLFLGSDTPVADASLVTISGGLWSNNHKGKGLCYAIIEADYDPDAFPSGEPQLTFVMEGAHLYDDRFDSTRSGGSGAQRLNNPATWTYNNLAALVAAQYLRGFYTGDVLIAGVGCEERDLWTPMLFDAYNICGSYVTNADLSVEPKYVANLLINAGEQAETVLTDLQSAMDGKILDRGGAITLRPGATHTATLNLTDADIVWTDEKSWQPKANVDQLCNYISGTFVDQTNLFNETSFPPWKNTAWETDDGGERFAQSYAFRAVTSPTQVQRITKRMYEATRLQGQVAFVLPIWCLGLEQDDWFTLTSARWGFATKWFVARTVDIQANLRIIVTAQEIDPAIDGWDPDTDERARTDTTWNPNAYTLPVPAIVVAPYSLYDQATNTQTFGLEVTLDDLLTDLTASARFWELQIAYDDDHAHPWSGGVHPIDVNPVDLVPLQPTVVYAVRGRTSDGVRSGPWSAWSSGTMPTGVPSGGNANYIYDPMNYPFVVDFDQVWDEPAGLGELAALTVTDGSGYAIQVGDAAGNDYKQLVYKRGIPYDAGALYTIEVDYEIITNTGVGQYLGLECLDNTGAILATDAGAHAYIALSGGTTLGRQTYRGYAQGTDVVGAGHNVGVQANDITAPSKLPSGTVKIKPLILANYPGANTIGKVVLHSVTLRKVYTADQVALLASLTAIASDGILTPAEKRTVVTDYTTIVSENAGLNSKATALGITTELSTLNTAYSALSTYLTGLTPGYTDYTQNTAIVRATFITKFSDYYTAKTALQNAMDQKAAQSAGGNNLVYFSLFEGNAQGWLVTQSTGAPTNSQGTTSGIPYFQSVAAASAAGQGIQINVALANRFAVTAGQWIGFSGVVGTAGVVANGVLGIQFYNSAGTQVGSDSVAFTGNQSFGTLLSKITQVPVGAVKANLFVGVVSSGAGSMTVQLGHPFATVVSQGTTAVPGFNAGPSNQPGADITGQNTSADTALVAGQAAATVTSWASIGNTMVADITDNNKFSSDEKKRYYQQITAWAGSGAGSVSAIVTLMNSYGLTAAATTLNSSWSNGSTGFFDYLVAYNYSTFSTTNVGSSGRTNLRNSEQAFENALRAAHDALSAYINNLAVAGSANLWTDPWFERVPATGQTSAEYTISGMNYGGFIESSDTRRWKQPATGATNLTSLQGAYIKVVRDDRIDITVDVYIDSSVTQGHVFFGGDFCTTGKVHNYYGNPMDLDATVLPRNVWITRTITIPLNTNWEGFYPYIQVGFSVGGNIYVRNPRIVRQASLLPTSPFTGMGSSNLVGLTVTPGITSVTLSNFSVDFGSGFIPITGGTYSGLTASTTYYVYMLCPYLADAGHSIVFSTTFSYTGNNPGQRMFLGVVTTQTSGGTGGSSGGGGGGGSFCVCTTNWLLDHLQAGDAHEGDIIDLLNATRNGIESGAIRHLRTSYVRCVRLTSYMGAMVEVSAETPLERLDGTQFKAPKAVGEQVAVCIEGKFMWDQCIMVEDIGVRKVAHIDVGDRTFFAGMNYRRRIATHNKIANP